MPIRFSFDEPRLRSDLTEFLRHHGQGAQIFGRSGLSQWNGILPRRVGDHYYESPWILCSSPRSPLSVDLSVFDADKSKTPSQTVTALANLTASTDWAIFPWGGYTRYGMLGIFAREETIFEAPLAPRTFLYKNAEDFGNSYHGILARRTRSVFAPPLWKMVGGEATPPQIIAFEYYEDAFQGTALNFSIEGGFNNSDGTRLSIYRMGDFKTFEYFIGLINTVSVFDVLPGSLTADACAEVRRLADGLELQDALQHTPWFFVCNGGEIDTNHLLFATSDHSLSSKCLIDLADALFFVSFF